VRHGTLAGAGAYGRSTVAPARVQPRPMATGLPWPKDPLRISLFLLMVLNISRVHQHFGAIGRLRPALLLAGATALYALMNPRYVNSDKLLRYWPARVILALAVLACASVPFGLSIGGSAMFILSSYSKTLIFAFLLIAAMRSVRDLNMFVWAFVISAGILIWFAWFVFGVSQGANSAMARLSGVYMWDSNDLGLVLLTALPLALLTLQTSRGRGRIVSLIILAGVGATIARTGSRGAFVGALAVGVALLLMLGHVNPVKRLFFVLVAGGTLVLTAPPGYWEQMKTITAPKEDYNWTSGYGRKRVWERGMTYMMSNPLTGIGIANYPRAEGTISDVAVNFVDRPGVKLKWSAAHNSFVQVAAELGIPGFLLWSTLVFGGIFSMYRVRRRLPRQWARGDPEERFLFYATIYLPVAFVAFLSTAFFLSFAYLEPVYILSAFVVGVYVSVDRKLGTAPRQPARKPGAGRPGPAWRQQLPTRQARST